MIDLLSAHEELSLEQAMEVLRGGFPDMTDRQRIDMLVAKKVQRPPYSTLANSLVTTVSSTAVGASTVCYGTDPGTGKLAVVLIQHAETGPDGEHLYGLPGGFANPGSYSINNDGSFNPHPGEQPRKAAVRENSEELILPDGEPLLNIDPRRLLIINGGIDESSLGKGNLPVCYLAYAVKLSDEEMRRVLDHCTCMQNDGDYKERMRQSSHGEIANAVLIDLDKAARLGPEQFKYPHALDEIQILQNFTSNPARETKKLRAAYLGSFRGFTRGHLDVVRALAKQFGEVIVGIGINPEKAMEFSLAELEANTRRILSDLPNVEVNSFSGLFNDFLDREKVDILVRGLRSGREFDEQIDQEHFDWFRQDKERERNGQMEPKRLTLYMPVRQQNGFISSSLVKKVLKEHGDPSGLAPTSTIAQLMGRLEHQYPYGITGVSGAGKRWICDKFKELADDLCIPMHYVDLDAVAHDMLEDRQERFCIDLRNDVARIFGRELMKDNGAIDRKKLGEIVFDDPAKMKRYNELIYSPLLLALRDTLNGKKGVLLLDGALSAEFGLTHLANHNFLVMDGEPLAQAERLKERDKLNEAQVVRRAESQYTTQKKIEIIKEAIALDDYGALQTLKNDGLLTPEDIRTAFDTMLEHVDIFGELRIKGFFSANKTVKPDQAYETIRSLYSGNDRRYHSLSHIVDGLNIIPKIEGQIENPKAFTLAWIFHDSMYDTALSCEETNSKSNGERSADKMAEQARAWGFDQKTIDCAADLIWQTETGEAAPVTNDEKLFVDLDMSILGRSPEEIAIYENELRIEHGSYTETDWIKDRTAFLQSLDTDNLFHTSFFRDIYGPQAKENVAASLARLRPRENLNQEIQGPRLIL
jgi:pantetheine-phosphate adenylyltransferase